MRAVPVSRRVCSCSMPRRSIAFNPFHSRDLGWAHSIPGLRLDQNGHGACLHSKRKEMQCLPCRISIA
jgi:hypothetical protein